MAANIVDASRVMGVDETGTLARLDDLRSADITPMLRAYNGRVVKSVGDSLLVAFDSVSEALDCAVEMQRTLLQRNENVPEYQKISYRIGINLGDAAGDQALYSDDVAMAMQASGLAQVGGICVSGKVLGALGDNLGLVCHEIDVKQPKNGDDAEPGQVYRVELPEDIAESPGAAQNAQAKALSAGAKLWILGIAVFVLLAVLAVILAL